MRLILIINIILIAIFLHSEEQPKMDKIIEKNIIDNLIIDINLIKVNDISEEKCITHVIKLVNKHLGDINQLSIFETAYFALLKKANDFTNRLTQEMLAYPNPFQWASQEILDQLAIKQSDSSAKTLAKIFSLQFKKLDGGSAELMLNAVVICGKPILPYLKIIEDEEIKPYVVKIIGMIEANDSKNRSIFESRVTQRVAQPKSEAIDSGTESARSHKENGNK